jgi:hypothetical protein
MHANTTEDGPGRATVVTHAGVHYYVMEGAEEIAVELGWEEE